MGIGKRRLGHATKGLARAWCLAIFLVSGEVEGYEEDQVGGERANASKSGVLLAGTLSSIRHPSEVSRCKVSVGREVDEA